MALEGGIRFAECRVATRRPASLRHAERAVSYLSPCGAGRLACSYIGYYLISLVEQMIGRRGWSQIVEFTMGHEDR